MERRRDEGEWTVVTHRRGRNRRRDRAEPPDRSPRYRFHESRKRPSYASVTRTGRGRDWDYYYPQRSSRQQGFQPQFFDRRRRHAPPQKQNRNSKFQQRAEAHRKQNTAPHTRMTRGDERPRSGDPDFGKKVRQMHKIIKIAHHLKNVTSSQIPPTIKKLSDNLATTIKPAIPNEKTQLLIEGNAKNWEYTTMILLRDHYTAVMEEELETLSQLSPHGWDEPFRVASSWARRNLGRRLQTETLEQTQALIIARQGDINERSLEEDAPQIPPPPPPPPPPSPLPPPQHVHKAQIHTQPKNTTLETEIRDSPQPRKPPNSKSTAAHTSPVIPQTTHKRSVCTMTDVIGGWSPCRQEDQCDLTSSPSTSLPPSQAPPLSPRPQRPPRPIRTTPTTTSPPPNPCCMEEDNSIMDRSMEELIDLGLETITPTPSSEMTKKTVIHSTPIKTQKLKSAVQSRLTLRPRLPPQVPTPSPVPSARRATKHIHTTDKSRDWGLSVNREWLVLGDSNVARIPPFSHDCLQVESYPGATFRHAEQIIRKAVVSTEIEQVEQVVLSFGINNRSQKERKTSLQQLLAATKAADERFPHAAVWIPLLNFSRLLPEGEQNNLKYLNKQIDKHCLSIPALPTHLFSTLSDHVHWTKATAKNMLQHWNEHINCWAP